VIISESLAAVSAEAERLYWRLVVMGDDWGWLDGDPEVLLPRALPRFIKRVTVADVERWLDELAAGSHPLAELWVLDGKTYIRLTGAASRNGQPIHFTVRANRSKHPAAAALDRCTRAYSCEQLRAIARKREQPRTIAAWNGNGNGNENGNVEKTCGAAGADAAPEPLTLTPPGEKAPKKKSGKGTKPNPDVKKLLDAAVAACEEFRKFKPVIRGAPDAKAMAMLLRGRSLDKAIELVREFYRDPPKWNLDQGALGLTNIPGAAGAILSRISGGGKRARDATGAVVPQRGDYDEVEDTVETDEHGVERSVRLYRSPATGEVTRRRWGKPTKAGGGGDGEQRGQVQTE
jgi:hypothetical protein